MSNEFRLNIAATTSQWLGIWSLSRVLKKCGWRVKASSDGTTKVVSDDPLQDKWNGTIATLGSGSAASITTIQAHPYGFLMTLTGLTGLVSPTTAPVAGRSEGNIIQVGNSTAANNGNWQVYQVLSATSCIVLNSGAGGTPTVDNSGAVTWTERDMASEVYGTGTTITDASVGWICLEGPETQQLAFTTAPTLGPGGANFVRGEPVTQAGTGATGECIGVVWESSVLSGWMIVMPRLGNFNNSGVITGSWSGAQITPTAFYRFRRQVVFNKTTGTNRNGGSWYECIRNDTEGANLFSALASSAGCTATIPPGSNGSGNAFPGNANAYAYVVRCVLNDGTTLTQTDGWYDKTIEGSNNTNSFFVNGRIHIAGVDAMPQQYRSADGSFWLLHCNTHISEPTNSIPAGTLFHFTRMDTVEPGEAELYAWFAHASNTNTNGRTICYSDSLASNAGFVTGTCALDIIGATKTNDGIGQNWQDQHRHLIARCVGSTQNVFTNVNTSFALTSYMTSTNDTTIISYPREALGTAHRVACDPLTVRPFFKESPVTANGNGGRFRWLFIAGVGNNFDTTDSLSNVCISPAYSTGSIPALYIGPFDGFTTLLQT